MKITSISKFLIFILFIQNFNCQSTCVCPNTNPDPPSKLQDKDSTFVAKSETIDGMDYGVPFMLSNLIFLKPEFVPGKSREKLDVKCPTGYRSPTSDEFQKLITDTGSDKIFSLLTDPSGFSAKVNMKFMTSTKTYPQITDGSDNKAWMFKGMFIDDSKKTVSIVDVNTYSDKNITVKCVQDTTGNLPLIFSQKDYFAGVSYPVSVSATNLVSYLWQWDNGKTASTSSANISFSSSGCYTVQVWAKNMANTVMYSCFQKYVVPLFGSDGSTSLTSNTVTENKLGYTIEPQKSIFFETGRLPIAPKPSGGLYVFYTDSKTKNLCVVEFDKDYKKLNEKNLELQAYAFDAVATEWGVVIYAKDVSDKNYSFLLGYTLKLEKKFQRTLMNNGQDPTARKDDQIVFYGKDNTPLSGLDAMFSPSNGKLAYGRKKIGLVFAHYNNFGLTSGKADFHTGDTFFAFDEDGKNETYAWGWKTSHSLIQGHLYDGRYFVTASLGDIYPENINVCFIDMTTTVATEVDPIKKGNFRHPSICKEIVPSKLPGNGGGKSCARFGGIVNKGENYAVIYSIRPCSMSAYGGGQTSTNDNAIAMVTFTFENFAFNNVVQMNIIKDASKVVNLRAGKYGDKILIAYVENPGNTDSGAGNSSYKTGDEMSYSLIGFDGVVQTLSLKATPPVVSTSDDMKFLSDGTLAWAYFDGNNNVSLFTTSAPPQKQPTNTTPSTPVLPSTSVLPETPSTILPSQGNSSEIISGKNSTNNTINGHSLQFTVIIYIAVFLLLV